MCLLEINAVWWSSHWAWSPILCIHNDLDYRILVSQGQAAFDAARLRGIEAEHLCFTDECHWVNKPQNSVLWYRVMIDWLNKYLK